MNKYQKEKENARQKAINFSNSQDALSYDELSNAQEKFLVLAKKYGLVGEFKENGII